MSDLPAAFRNFLAASYRLPSLAVEEAVADDAGTTKYLFRTHDGLKVEAVFIPGADHDAVCLSSQVGCGYACGICATGRLGFRRNLTAYEMVSQFALIQKARAPGRVRNAVFMGQGEPLATMAGVWQAVARLKGHFGVGGRRITVSTVGLPDRIREWADGGPPVKLAVSLNSARQPTRDKLMPKCARFPLPELAAACRYYVRKTGRHLTFEYVLCAGINDDLTHARALAAFTNDIPSKINVIPFNRWPGAPYRPPGEKTLETFLKAAAEGPRIVTVRRSQGLGINAACGMLAARGLAREAARRRKI
jgi:23S rRNA (adenine2503-C2)-methyltransferase